MSTEPLNENKGSPPSNVLGDILEMLSSERESGGGTHKDGEATSEKDVPVSTPPQSDVFSAILSNPALLAKLPSIISAAKPIIEAFGKQNALAVKSDGESVTSNDSLQASSGAPSNAHTVKQPLDRRAALLCAMKPYLCRDRQEAIDYIIKLSRLGDILRSL